MPRIFISYRRADSETLTGRIHDRLVTEFGFNNVFLDVERGNIPAGEDFRNVLRNAVSKCDVLLAIIGPRWIDVSENDNPELRRLDNIDDFVRIEIATGLEREQTDGTLIIPVLVGGASMPNAKDLPNPLREIAFRHAHIIRGNPDFHQDMTLLVNRLNEYFTTLEQPIVALPPSKRGLSRGRLVVGITTLLVITAIIIAIIATRQPPPASPVEIANQRLTQTSAIQIANRNTQAAEDAINGIMTQFVTLTNDANAHTSTSTFTSSNTPTEDIITITNAQETLNAQATANLATDTQQPTATFTPSLTSSFTPNHGATETAKAIQLATAQQNARMIQAALSTQTAEALPTPTRTPSPTKTPSRTPTSTQTATLKPTQTPTQTATLKPTLIPSPTSSTIGTIAGQILWNNQPVVGIDVELIPDSCLMIPAIIVTKTDNTGHYWFDNVKPDDYVIGVNGYKSGNRNPIYETNCYSYSFQLKVGKHSQQDRSIKKLNLILLSPTKNSNIDSKATFKWQAYPEAAYYVISLFNRSSSSEPIYTDVNTTEATINLRSGDSYEGWIIAYNNNGTEIAEATIPQFTVR